jgi:competence ComEA-like helix-hairpin-helix protein
MAWWFWPFFLTWFFTPVMIAHITQGFLFTTIYPCRQAGHAMSTIIDRGISIDPDAATAGAATGWTAPNSISSPAPPVNPLTRWFLQKLDPATVALWLTTALVTGLMAGQWIWLSRQRPEPLLLRPAPRADAFTLDINSASWVEWMQVRGIGPNLANRIVADRRLRGPYRTLADLQRVSGIGPDTLQRLGSALTIRHENSNAPVESSFR